jgi:predicted  nucleic acid-binding Zn-ribbon protein
VDKGVVTLNADPDVQVRLLDIADHDKRIAQLHHRRQTLPQAQEAQELSARMDRLDGEIVAAETIVSDVKRELARADADVEQVRERSRKDQELLDSGSINDPKQLQNLQHELTSLARRQAELEDVELEVMERAEGAAAAVTVLTAERVDVGAKLADVQVELEQIYAEIDAELTQKNAERGALAETVPTDLFTLYEKIRADHGGVGAARMQRGTCTGCQISLPPTDVEALRDAPPNAVIRCEECRCILIRTDESGL